MRSLSFHNKQCCFRRAREHYSSPKMHAVKTQTRVILLCIEARRWQFVLRILLTQHSSSLTNTKTAAWLSACLEAWDSSKSSSSKTYPCLSKKTCICTGRSWKGESCHSHTQEELLLLQETQAE